MITSGHKDKFHSLIMRLTSTCVIFMTDLLIFLCIFLLQVRYDIKGISLSAWHLHLQHVILVNQPFGIVSVDIKRGPVYKMLMTYI